MHSIGASIYLEVELENTLEETSVIQLELEKEFGGTGPHLEVELEKVFQLLWSLLPLALKTASQTDADQFYNQYRHNILYVQFLFT